MVKTTTTTVMEQDRQLKTFLLKHNFVKLRF